MDTDGAWARQRGRDLDDGAAKADRRSPNWVAGRDARIAGKSRGANPWRYVPGKSSPEHPDIWEAQWDLGFEEGGRDAA